MTILPAGSFARALRGTIPCAASTDTLPILAGVSIVSDGSTVTFATTDRYTLSVGTVTLADAADPFAVVIPAKLLKPLATAAGKRGVGIVRLTVDGDKLTVEIAEQSWTLTSIDGAFPRYTSLFTEPGDTFPAEFGVTAEYLARFTHYGTHGAVRVRPGSTATRPLLIDAAKREERDGIDGVTFRGLIMPVRLGN